jgi:hypothetical protein
LIPRAISMIFKQARDAPATEYSCHISYLEIYNEQVCVPKTLPAKPYHNPVHTALAQARIACLPVSLRAHPPFFAQGFDLLDPSHETKALEELPRVTMMTDADGNTILKNLSMHRANTVRLSRGSALALASPALLLLMRRRMALFLVWAFLCALGVALFFSSFFLKKGRGGAEPLVFRGHEPCDRRDAHELGLQPKPLPVHRLRRVEDARQRHGDRAGGGALCQFLP